MKLGTQLALVAIAGVKHVEAACANPDIQSKKDCQRKMDSGELIGDLWRYSSTYYDPPGEYCGSCNCPKIWSGRKCDKDAGEKLYKDYNHCICTPNGEKPIPPGPDCKKKAPVTSQEEIDEQVAKGKWTGEWFFLEKGPRGCDGYCLLECTAPQILETDLKERICQCVDPPPPPEPETEEEEEEDVPTDGGSGEDGGMPMSFFPPGFQREDCTQEFIDQAQSLMFPDVDACKMLFDAMGDLDFGNDGGQGGDPSQGGAAVAGPSGPVGPVIVTSGPQLSGMLTDFSGALSICSTNSKDNTRSKIAVQAINRELAWNWTVQQNEMPGYRLDSAMITFTTLFEWESKSPNQSYDEGVIFGRNLWDMYYHTSIKVWNTQEGINFPFEGYQGSGEICVHDRDYQYRRNCETTYLYGGSGSVDGSHVDNIEGVKNGDFFMTGRIDRISDFPSQLLDNQWFVGTSLKWTKPDGSFVFVDQPFTRLGELKNYSIENNDCELAPNPTPVPTVTVQKENEAFKTWTPTPAGAMGLLSTGAALFATVMAI